MSDWKGKKVVIIGAARQGLALARYLSNQDAVVLLTDSQPEEEFTQFMDEFSKLSINTNFGGHPLSLLDGCSLVCVSGGVPLELEIIQEAKNRGIPLSNDSQIFFESCRTPIIGITGSAGKTTTTTLVGRMGKFALQEEQQIWVGGNIGTPLITFLDSIQPEDPVILELSSFQLELMTTSPAIAAITNITPNHLDRHGTMEAYTQAKANILKFQKTPDIAVLNRDDPGSWKLRGLVKGSLISFGLIEPDHDFEGTYSKDGSIWLRKDGNEVSVCSHDSIQLRGEHNLINCLAACAIAGAAGFPVDAMRKGIEEVKGVPHRLEYVRTINGADWYNDSIATAPERTIAAVRSFEEPQVLLLGGRDKNLPWQTLAAEVHGRAKHITLFGEAAELIEKALSDYEGKNLPYTIGKFADLNKAVQNAAEHAEDGDVVLLSPGGTSYDAYKDFEERGEHFKKIVESLK